MLNSGTWKKVVTDRQGGCTTLLTLQPDGTYLKEMTVVMAGAFYARRLGGSHQGTWSVHDGNRIHLSGGDGWPPSTEDLGEFQKIAES
jgi:hypothetical protein